MIGSSRAAYTFVKIVQFHPGFPRTVPVLTSLMQAYDSHCNLVLGEVEETIYIVEEDENEQEVIKVGGDVQEVIGV